ncbi:beta-2-microglobulin [Rhinoderma darwinii]|uniref:beta-2-microglobulin n=1 Tax=Rhinoderma darwinii TaxID=43563 RepID=UPI003F669F8E
MRSAVSAISVALLLIVALTQTQADIKAPKVNIYTQSPVEYGVKNTLICHASGFHPPRIDIRLMKDGVEIKNFQESDLSFEQDWTYYKTKHAEFTPRKGENYQCAVTHDNGETRTYILQTY